MWAFVHGFVFFDRIEWKFSSFSETIEHESSVGVRLSIEVANGPDVVTRRAVMTIIKRGVLSDPACNWITPGDGAWAFNLDKLAKMLPSPERFSFLRGIVDVEPEYEVDTQLMPPDRIPHYWGNAVFFITPNARKHSLETTLIPATIVETLDQFRTEYPDPTKAAFLMMSFESTIAHELIVKTIRECLANYGIKALRADEHDYSEDLFANVQTYMHGCGFGIAVFERIASDAFNPNVGLEVGYMLAMGKKVCLLKDRTLTSLQTDLMGKLYKKFDVQSPKDTIPKMLEAWLQDRGLVVSESGEAVYESARRSSNSAEPAQVLREELRCMRFISYLDDWEMIAIATAILIDESPNLAWHPNQSGAFSLVSKGFIESVPQAKAPVEGSNDKPITFVFPANVWRYLVDGREWWLYRAIERCKDRPEMLAKFEKIRLQLDRVN